MSSSAPLTSKIFVGGISQNTTETAFASYFSRFGEIKDAVIMRDKLTGASRGFGFVRFADASSLDKVLSQELELDGRKVDVKIAVPKESIGEAPGLHRTRKVFVGGLSPKVTSEELRAHFAQFGTVVNAIIMMDTKTNKSRGFGFVTFDAENTVDTVLARTHILSGKPVEIKKAVPREKISSEGGRGGGGGRGADAYGGYGGDYYGYPPFGYGYPPFPPPPRFREDFYGWGAAAGRGSAGRGFDESGSADGWGQQAYGEAATGYGGDENPYSYGAGFSASGRGGSVGRGRGRGLGDGMAGFNPYAAVKSQKGVERSFHPYGR